MKSFGLCVLCGAPAIAKCDWPVERFVVASYGSLEVGDTVRRFLDREERRAPADVMDVEDILDEKMRPIRQVVLSIRGTRRVITAITTSRVRVQRQVPCGDAVCEIHVRELDPERHHCSAHWFAWEAVA